MTPLIFCYYQHQLRSALLQVVSLKVILWPDQVSSRHVAVFTDEIRLRFSLHVCGKAGKATPASSVAARWARSWITSHVARLVSPFPAGRGAETEPGADDLTWGSGGTRRTGCLWALALVVRGCVHVKVEGRREAVSSVCWLNGSPPGVVLRTHVPRDSEHQRFIYRYIKNTAAERSRASRFSGDIQQTCKKVQSCPSLAVGAPESAEVRTFLLLWSNMFDIW